MAASLASAPDDGNMNALMSPGQICESSFDSLARIYESDHGSRSAISNVGAMCRSGRSKYSHKRRVRPFFGSKYVWAREAHNTARTNGERQWL